MMMMRRFIKVSFGLLYILTATLFSISSGADTLTPDHPLADYEDGGTTLISADGSFELGFFSPAGSNNNNRYIGIWYHNICDRTIVWVANRERPVAGCCGRLSIRTDGTLVVADKNSTIVWFSTSQGLANPVARLLDNGNFVVREDGRDDLNSFAWQSFDFPTDTLLPGMKIGWNLTSGLARNLTAWTSPSDPASSEYGAGLDFRGNPQVYLWSRTGRLWRGGSWNGLQFNGIPDMKAENVFDMEFVVDSHEILYSFYMRDTSIISRVVLHHSGVLQRFVWIEDSKKWSVFYEAPKDECDNMLSPCGPDGVCYPSVSPMCECLPGFEPKNPGNWVLRDWSDGCARKTALDCRNGTTDGFTTLSNVKLPDTSRSTVDRSMSLEQCSALCLRNCSCTAYASANISGRGCIIWTTELTDIKVYDSGSGQDIYIRVAAAVLVRSEPTHLSYESNYSRRSHVVVIIVVPALAIFLLACVACCVWKGKKKTSRRSDEETQGQGLDLPIFDLATIVDATGNFSIENKLGEGGFGPVYKGKLGEGQEIAVKRLSETSVQGLDEFKNEVMLITKLQHRNLVRLLGFCIQRGERMLIYEYMPNGSLDAFLFDKAKDGLLDWRTCYNVILGIARGLLYLHQDSRFRIIHRDLKASNILLDKDMNPKISDFGMAKIFGGDETTGKTKRVVGTYGYMSPEYVMNGIFSVKSDVFSFGVLLLEIISGKRNGRVNHSTQHLNLLDYIWRLRKKGKVLELVDRSIDPSFSKVEVSRCIDVGLLCVEERPEDRPTMSSVVLMLGSDGIQLPQPRQPSFIVARDASKPDSSRSKQDSFSINGVSITTVEAR